MRTLFDFAPTMGVIPIEEIQVNPKSRDDIPRIVLALQSIWMNSGLRDQIVAYIRDVVAKDTDQNLGRSGMNYWRIFVLAVFKYGLDCDFDRLVHMANHDGLVRELLQNDNSTFNNKPDYSSQTVINNVSLITEEIWAHLNHMIVDHGHEVLGVAPDAPMEARCDSYVAETHIETPHDVRMLRNVVLLLIRVASKAWVVLDLKDDKVPGWRQRLHLIVTLKNAYLEINTSRKRAKHPELVLNFFDLCYRRIRKCMLVLNTIQEIDPTSSWIPRMEKGIAQFNQLVDLVHRRVIEGEKIPNAEKLLSLHAEHTRWIRKGKSFPNEVELGVPVAVIQNQHHLILGWEIMWETSDVEMTVPIVDKYTAAFPNLESISFDRGYWSVPNYEALRSREIQVILPKKGYKNKEERARESTSEFREKRRRHAQIESGINCLEQHGGARIRTKGGKTGFARTIGASVVATNLCRIGKVLMDRRREAFRQAA